ncbi:MAG: flagellin [Pseudomonadota bacterium]
MERISTFGQTSFRTAQLRRLESDLATANREIATGKKDDVAESLGAQLVTLQTIRNQYSENEEYLRTTDVFNQRASLMQNSLVEANNALVDLLEIASINSGSAAVSASAVPITADTVIDRIAVAFNIEIQGRFLFSGDEVNNATVTQRGTVGPGGVTPDEIATEIITGTAPGALAGPDLSTPADAVEAEAVIDRFEAVFQGGAGSNSLLPPPEQFYSFEESFFGGQLGGNLTEIRLPSNTVATQDNDQFVQGLRDILQGAYMLANVDLNAITDPEAYQTFMTGGTTGRLGAVDRIAQGLEAIQEVQGDLGLQQQLVEASRIDTESEQALFNNEIVALEEADPFETQTRFLQIERQLEASYLATERAYNLTLLNFIR